MDTMFRVLSEGKEVYLLEKLGICVSWGVMDWVKELKEGVLKADGSRHDICQYDIDNLQWSGKALLNSIDLDLWAEIEKELSYNASGPEVFASVIERMQQVNASTVRTLVDD